MFLEDVTILQQSIASMMMMSNFSLLLLLVLLPIYSSYIVHPRLRKVLFSKRRDPSLALAAEVTLDQIKTVRERTGAGISKCKEALVTNEGNVEQSVKWLIQREFASMDKKMSRETRDGLIGVYVHRGSKMAAMVEVNCETDFVSRRPEFLKFANSLALQVAASDGLRYVYEKDIPEEDIVAQMENEIIMYNRDQKTSFNHVSEVPDDVKEILRTKAKKSLKQQVLMEQKYYDNNDMTVDEYVRSQILSCGENIYVKRFTLFKVGE